MNRQKNAVGTNHGGAITTAAKLLLSTPNYSTNHTNLQAPFSPAVSSLLDQAQARYEAELEQARAHWRAAQAHKAIKASLERQFLGGATR